MTSSFEEHKLVINKIKEKSFRCVISPDSTFRTIIDFISFIFIIMISLYLPVIFALEIDTLDSNFIYFEVILDIWFIVEIFLNCFTGFFKHG